MSLNALELADNVQLSLQADSTAASHPSSIPRLKGRQQAQKTPSVARVFTEDVRHNRPPYPVIQTASAGAI
jgi:hypothetical protein